jgi:carbon starvation protein
MVQDLVGLVAPSFKKTDAWGPSIVATAISVGAWGYFLYQGVTDPLGGINTLWPLFGISNQMLAAVALTLCTVVIFKMKREKYAFVTIIPTVWLCICTLTAGYQKIFSADPKIGFLAHADRYATAAAEGKLLAPAKNAGQMSQIILNDRIDAVLASLFIALVVAIAVFGVMACAKALRADRWTALETDPKIVPAE